jgi:hypothetical protein
LPPLPLLFLLPLLACAPPRFGLWGLLLSLRTPLHKE